MGMLPLSAATHTFTLSEIIVPGLSSTVATGINKSGAIIGYGAGASGTVSFLDLNGTFTFLAFPGSTDTRANGINDAGDIVGTYFDPPGPNAGSHGFKYSGAAYNRIDAPSPAAPNTTSLQAINNSGQMAGNASVAAFSNGFVDTGGSFAFLPNASGEGTFISGLNDSGEIVGAVFSGSSGNSPMYGTSNAYSRITSERRDAAFRAVNNRGQVSLATTGNGGEAVSYILASPTDPDRSRYVQFPGAQHTTVSGLTDSGTVVGGYFTPNGPNHAFIGPSPGCVITGLSGTQRQVTFTVQDITFGLNQIVAQGGKNSNINIPPFPNGTTDPVVVKATASDPSQPAIPSIVVSNVAGATTNCTSEIAPAPPVWTGLGGISESNVSVGKNSDGSLEAFVVGTDGGLWHSVESGPAGAFGPWLKLSGTTDALTGDPSVFSDDTGALQLLITSSTGALLNIAQPFPGNWVGANWHSIQSGVTGNVAAVVDAAGVANVFVRAADNSVEWLTQHTSSAPNWSVEFSLGGILISNPIAILDAERKVQVYGIGQDNALWNTGIMPQGNIVPWASLGGSLKGNPAVIASAETLYAFSRGTDDSLWVNSQASGASWAGWQGLGGVLIDNPRAAANSDGRVEAFVAGSDGAVWHKSQVSSGSSQWTDWSTVSKVILGDVFPIVDPAAILNIFALGSDQSLWQLKQPLPDNWQ